MNNATAEYTSVKQKTFKKVLVGKGKVTSISSFTVKNVQEKTIGEFGSSERKIFNAIVEKIRAPLQTIFVNVVLIGLLIDVTVKSYAPHIKVTD